jgi:hypothetical protein
LESLFSNKISFGGEHRTALELADQVYFNFLAKVPLVYMQKLLQFYVKEVNPDFNIKERLTSKQLVLY